MAAPSLERDEPAPLQGKIDRDSHLPKPKRARRRNELELLADTRGPLPLNETRRLAHQAATTSRQKNVGAIKGTRAPASINARFRVVKRTTKPKIAKKKRQIDKLFGVGKRAQGGSDGVKEASAKLDADGSLGGVKIGTMLGSDHADYFRAKDTLEEQGLGRNEMVDFVQNALETYARVLSNLPRTPTIPISPQEEKVAHKHARSPEPEEAQGTKRQQTYRAASWGSHDRDRRRSSNDGLQASPSVQSSPPRAISRAHDLVPETETDSFPSYVRNRAFSSSKIPSTPTLKREERHLSSENISPISVLLSSPDSPMFVNSSPSQPTEGADAALDSTGTANTSRRESQDGSKTDDPELPEIELTPRIQSPVTEGAKPRSVLRNDEGQLPEKPSAEVTHPHGGTTTNGELKQDGENSQRQNTQIPSEIAAAPNTMATDGLAQGSTPLRISTRDSPRRSLGGVRTDLVSSRSYTLKSPPGTPGSCEPSSRPPTPPPQHVDIDIDLGVAAQPRLESPLRTAASAEDDAMEESEPASPTQQENDQIPGIRSPSSYDSDESAKEAEPLSSGAVRMPFADMGQEPYIAAAGGISSPSGVANPFHSGRSPPRPAANPFRAATESPKPAHNPFQATYNPFSAATRDDTPSILVSEKPLPAVTNESEEAQTLSSSRPPPSPEHGALSIRFHPLRGFTVGIALGPDTSATDATPAASSSTLRPRTTEGASVGTRTPQPSSSWMNLRVPASEVQLVRPQPEADDRAKIPLRPLVGRASPAAGGSSVGEKTSVEVAEASLEAMTGEEDEEEREGEEWKEEKKKKEKEYEEEASVVGEKIVQGEGEGDVETAGRADDAQHDDSGEEEDYYMSDDADLYSTCDEPPNDSVGTERCMSDEEKQQQWASENQDQTDQPIEQISDTDAHARADDQDDDEYVIPYDPASPLIDKPAPPIPAQTAGPSPPLWADGIPGLAYSGAPTATTGASAEAAASTRTLSLSLSRPDLELLDATQTAGGSGTAAGSSSVDVETPASGSWTARGDATAADPASGDAIDGDKLDDDEMEDLFGSEE